MAYTASQQRSLRACMVCSIILPYDDFLRGGCPNCEDVLQLMNQPDQINECTSQVFDGVIMVNEPGKSWVSRWQRVDGYEKGCYAVKVTGVLPEDVIEELQLKGREYIPYAALARYGVTNRE